MRYILLLSTFLIISCSKTQEDKSVATSDQSVAPEIIEKYIYCGDYERLYRISPDSSKADLLYKGSDPSASRDGKQIAFTENGKDVERRIGIYDQATKQKRILTNITNDNSYGATFSPDGFKLTFNTFTGSQWMIGIIGANNSGFRTLTKPMTKKYASGYFAPTWISDGSGIVCHDIDSCYTYSLSGERISVYPMNMFVPDEQLGLSSSSRVYLDAKNKRYFIEAGSDIEDGDDVGAYAIYIFDIPSKTAKRITPDTLSATNPIWSENRQLFYFRGYSNEDLCKAMKMGPEAIPEYKIYSIKADGADIRVILHSRELPTQLSQ
jgi:Tol biopolymer transport system component